MKIDGWELKTENGALVAYTRGDAVSVSLSDDGESILVRDNIRYYPTGKYSLPLAVIDELRRRGEPKSATPHGCTGLTARWCPNHGNCVCERTPAGDCDFDGSACPLHSADSSHAEAPPPLDLYPSDFDFRDWNPGGNSPPDGVLP